MADQPLTNLSVIITRPAKQAASLQQRLDSLGATTLLLPVLEISPELNASEQAAIKNLILDFDHFEKAIFVSQNAVKYGFEWIDQYWPQLPVGMTYFAVGEATAAALAEHVESVNAADTAMNSETLLALPALEQVNQQKIIIFRGVGGRTLLGDVLIERGATVRYCELYQRKLPTQAAALFQDLHRVKPSNAVLSVHSGESLQNFVSLLDTQTAKAWKTTPVLVPGERVATLANEAGFEQILIAENATDRAMIDALIQWYQH